MSYLISDNKEATRFEMESWTLILTDLWMLRIAMILFVRQAFFLRILPAQAYL